MVPSNARHNILPQSSNLRPRTLKPLLPTMIFRVLLILIPLALTACSTAPAPSRTIAPSMAGVSIPLQGTRDAIATAQDRLKAGDLAATGTALSVAAVKAEMTSAALVVTQEKVDVLEKKIVTADSIIAAKDKEIHELAKERDIIPYIVALCLALWVVLFCDGLPIPEQYRFWVKIGGFAIGFASGYALGRVIVRFIAQFLP